MNKEKVLFRKFMILWLGQFISAIGTGLTSFGLGVYVYELTKKASLVALISLFAFLPSILLGPLAGVLADRYDRRLLMIIGDSFSALGPLFILFSILFGKIELWQIFLGVLISSVFSSLLEPAFKATITDLLDENQYSKASGLNQLAGSAKYLISPLLAGMLLVISDIELLLMTDIFTIVITVCTTIIVRKGIAVKVQEERHSFIADFKEGWNEISKKEGVKVLVAVTSLMTFYVGIIQTLTTPLILAFSNSAVLGMIETLSALGMLFTSFVIGIISIKSGYLKMLSKSLFFAGICMFFFGLRENIFLICISGFVFFAMLPFANTSLDYLIRININNSVQGRVWGLIGLISQSGYVIAYAVSGLLADYLFTPLFIEGGLFYNSLGKIIGTGTGRGTGFLIMITGLLLSVTAIFLYHIKSIQKLEKRGEICI